MPTLISGRPRLLAYAAGALLLVALVTAAGADASTIYTCKKKNGTIRIVSKSAKCKKGETKLSWNSVGPSGKDGATGATGAIGKEGKEGKEGKQGKEGLPGESATNLFAVVAASGALERGSGALSASKLSTGQYQVQFAQGIGACAWLGTVGTIGFGGEEPGDIDLAGRVGTTDTLFIETRSNGGTLENKSFHVALFC
jgi:hypothetical protein